jgi:hypothetical protein
MYETIKTDGNRPLTLFELLAFGQKFRHSSKWPDVNVTFVALGSSWNNQYPTIINNLYLEPYMDYRRELQLYNNKNFVPGYLGQWFYYFPSVCNK